MSQTEPERLGLAPDVELANNFGLRATARLIASNKTSLFTGLSRKSTAPALIAVTLARKSPCPVMNTIER